MEKVSPDQGLDLSTDKNVPATSIVSGGGVTRGIEDKRTPDIIKSYLKTINKRIDQNKPDAALRGLRRLHALADALCLKLMNKKDQALACAADSEFGACALARRLQAILDAPSFDRLVAQKLVTELDCAELEDEGGGGNSSEEEGNEETDENEDTPSSIEADIDLAVEAAVNAIIEDQATENNEHEGIAYADTSDDKDADVDTTTILQQEPEDFIDLLPSSQNDENESSDIISLLTPTENDGLDTDNVESEAVMTHVDENTPQDTKDENEASEVDFVLTMEEDSNDDPANDDNDILNSRELTAEDDNQFSFAFMDEPEPELLTLEDIIFEDPRIEEVTFEPTPELAEISFQPVDEIIQEADQRQIFISGTDDENLMDEPLMDGVVIIDFNENTPSEAENQLSAQILDLALVDELERGAA